MKATAITQVTAWEALDSRGNPTVSCEVRLSSGAHGSATVPSGASTGAHEAVELRDGGDRYAGLGVRTAVRNVNEVLGRAVAGLDASEQEVIDEVLVSADGTANLERLGANAVLALSVASAVAAANAKGHPLYMHVASGEGPLLPMPMVNIISGGAHAGGAVDVQDVLAVPVGASSFEEAIEWAWRVRRATAQVAAERGLNSVLVADEGGLGPPMSSNRAALELLLEGIERSGLVAGDQVAIAIDVAASQLTSNGGYRLGSEHRTLDALTLIEEIEVWCKEFPIVSIEDPLSEEDWAGWSTATRRFGESLQLVGDDLFATNLERLERGIKTGVANAILVKPNQNGTLSGARRVLERARDAGYATVLSARSGETEDAWLADLAVGWRAGQIKVGSLTRSERTAKWNRLLRIEKELGNRASFAGSGVLQGQSSNDSGEKRS